MISHPPPQYPGEGLLKRLKEIQAMQSSRMARLLVLVLGVVFGYFAVGGLSRAVHETIVAPKLATSQDETCSTASPETATCEMPVEMSRADWFRLQSSQNEK